MEKDLSVILWPEISKVELGGANAAEKPAVSAEARAANPPIPKIGKGRMPKFVTLEKNERIEALVPEFRRAVASENPIKIAEIAIDILDEVKRNGGDYREITVVRDHLEHALGKYKEGAARAGEAIMAKIGTEGVVESIAEARDRTKPVVKRAFNPIKANFADTVYRIKYNPAGNSLGAFLYGLSKFNLAKHLADKHISELDQEAMPGNYKGKGGKWVSKRSLKKAEKKAEEDALKQKRKDEREKAREERAKKKRKPVELISRITGRKL